MKLRRWESALLGCLVHAADAWCWVQAKRIAGF